MNRRLCAVFPDYVRESGSSPFSTNPRRTRTMTHNLVMFTLATSPLTIQLLINVTQAIVKWIAR